MIVRLTSFALLFNSSFESAVIVCSVDKYIQKTCTDKSRLHDMMECEEIIEINLPTDKLYRGCEKTIKWR